MFWATDEFHWIVVLLNLSSTDGVHYVQQALGQHSVTCVSELLLNESWPFGEFDSDRVPWHSFSPKDFSFGGTLLIGQGRVE